MRKKRKEILFSFDSENKELFSTYKSLIQKDEDKNWLTVLAHIKILQVGLSLKCISFIEAIQTINSIFNKMQKNKDYNFYALYKIQKLNKKFSLNLDDEINNLFQLGLQESIKNNNEYTHGIMMYAGSFSNESVKLSIVAHIEKLVQAIDEIKTELENIQQISPKKMKQLEEYLLNISWEIEYIQDTKTVEICAKTFMSLTSYIAPKNMSDNLLQAFLNYFTNTNLFNHDEKVICEVQKRLLTKKNERLAITLMKYYTNSHQFDKAFPLLSHYNFMFSTILISYAFKTNNVKLLEKISQIELEETLYSWGFSAVHSNAESIKPLMHPKVIEAIESGEMDHKLDAILELLSTNKNKKIEMIVKKRIMTLLSEYDQNKSLLCEEDLIEYIAALKTLDS